MSTSWTPSPYTNVHGFTLSVHVNIKIRWKTWSMFSTKYDYTRYQIGIGGGQIPSVKTARKFSLSLSQLVTRLEWQEVYPHFSICLHDLHSITEMVEVLQHVNIQCTHTSHTNSSCWLDYFLKILYYTEMPALNVYDIYVHQEIKVYEFWTLITYCFCCFSP